MYSDLWKKTVANAGRRQLQDSVDLKHEPDVDDHCDMTSSEAVEPTFNAGLSDAIHDLGYSQATMGSGQVAPSPFALEFFPAGHALFVDVDTNDAMPLDMQDSTPSSSANLHLNCLGCGRLEGESAFGFGTFTPSYQTVCDLCSGRGVVLFIASCPCIEHLPHVQRSVERTYLNAPTF